MLEIGPHDMYVSASTSGRDYQLLDGVCPVSAVVGDVGMGDPSMVQVDGVREQDRCGSGIVPSAVGDDGLRSRRPGRQVLVDGADLQREQLLDQIGELDGNAAGNLNPGPDPRPDDHEDGQGLRVGMRGVPGLNG